MTEALPRLLWIGNRNEARETSQGLGNGIEALVDLALEELPPRVTRELVYCRFPMIDGSGNPPRLLRAAVETVASLIEKRIVTLVFCGAGMSRAPAIVAAALAVSRGSSPDEALKSLAAGRPHDVSGALWTVV